MASSLEFPPLIAIFLTHFDDTKGQSVLYYKSYDEAKLQSGTIEHASLPSGLHLMEEDMVTFQHGFYSAVGLFRSRTIPVETGGGGGAEGVGGSKAKGRGRRMATVGVVLADRDSTDEVFRLKDTLGEVYDRIEALTPSAFGSEGREGLDALLDGLWESFGSVPKVSTSTSTSGGTEGKGGGYRRTVEGEGSLPIGHPLGYLPELVRLLGPQVVTVYKAALSGRRILLYAQPPLLKLSAFAYCIAAMSLPPRYLSQRHEGKGLTEWIGQVGLMDLDSLYQRQGPWVATTSDKILLLHPKIYDLSIDLSTPTPELRMTNLNPGSGPRLLTYSFGDIPLYRTLQALSTGPRSVPELGLDDTIDDPDAEHPGQSSSSSNSNSNSNSGTSAGAGAGATDDWWMTFYDLVDRVWSLCTGVCEYAIGKGRVGEISLGRDRIEGGRVGQVGGEGEDPEESEDTRLLNDHDHDDAEQADEGKMETQVGRGRIIMRQLYHNTHHLYQRLRILDLNDHDGSGGITKRQARNLTGQWIVSEDDVRFWTDLKRRWGGSSQLE